MNVPFGGLYITAGATALAPTSTAAKVNPATDWTAMAATAHGDLSVVPSAANGRLTLKPGIYEVNFQASVNQTDTSGTSEAGQRNELVFQVYLDQVAVAGTKSVISGRDVENTQTVSITSIIEVAAGAVGQCEIYCLTRDVASMDATILEARFTAKRLDG